MTYNPIPNRLLNHAIKNPTLNMRTIPNYCPGIIILRKRLFTGAEPVNKSAPHRYSTCEQHKYLLYLSAIYQARFISFISRFISLYQVYLIHITSYYPYLQKHDRKTKFELSIFAYWLKEL